MIEFGKCDITELRSLFLFETLADEQLRSLCEHGRVEDHEPGVVFRADEPATRFYVLLDGTITLTQRVGTNELETTRTGQRGAYAGAWTEADGNRYQATLRAVTRVRVFTLPARDFGQLIALWFPMALHLLEGVFYGNRNAQRLVGERERLLALGSLSAGLTHELNNPAAAVARAASSLLQSVERVRRNPLLVTSRAWNRRQLEGVLALQERAVEQVGQPSDLSPLETSDLEDELVAWLDDQEFADTYELAPTLVQAGLDVGWLGELESLVGHDFLDRALHWLIDTVEIEILVREIQESTTRISSLVTAAKEYSQMDRAPHQVLDVHHLLDSTLVLLSPEVGSVRVSREYDRTLPDIPVYGAELNRVWTNLIDNALRSMNGTGTLTLRTWRDGEHVQVEIHDTGPGIPPEAMGQVFEPSFTTNPRGPGTVLGLDIAWRIVVDRHHGELSVTSAPGDTRFRVRLPLRDEAAVAE